ncbi:hypothetical protein SELMODRAFT_424595 [Selaginella moellendorffii]|uniref:Bulb-type lectin domain-containing protein n=1 Tax=Selaginella moellendorffii TaxID=88036 RepID=D8SQE9_SELML|nr:hypothetical protein SELMODRAFT_424595 [Selaginella moellendorffii]
MHWEFSDERNAITTADANIILDTVIALADIFDDNTYYESGAVYINQVTVTNNVVIDIAIVAFHTGPNLDFCHVNPGNTISVRGLVIKAIIRTLVMYTRGQMQVFLASSMLAVSEMFGVQYRIAPADQQMETLHNHTKILLGSDRGDCQAKLTTLDNFFYNGLRRNFELQSPNLIYTFKLQDDCSLSLNEASRGQVWTNGVCGRGGVDCYLTVQLNGNMVIKETLSQVVIWSLDKSCDEPCYAFVTIQRDRNVVLYHVFKSSPGVCPPYRETTWQHEKVKQTFTSITPASTNC